MSVNVYAWPPVSLQGWMWSLSDPIQRSRSIITGAEYISAGQRRRRMVAMEVAGIGKSRMDAGYIESLIELLKGGQNCVRLHSCRINPRGGVAASLLRSQRLEWKSGTTDLDWTASGTELIWYTGTILTGTSGTDAAGWPIITVSGLPPDSLVAKPSEFIAIFADESDTVGATYRVLSPAYSNASGVAVIRLHEDPGILSGVRVNLRAQETAVFRPVTIPSSIQPAAGNWSYSWEFREVFEDEVGPGGFVEVNPWT